MNYGTSLIGPELMDFTMNGRSKKRCGNDDEIMAPHGVYRCKGDDKWISIAVKTDAEWAALVNAMGNPAWALDGEKYGNAYSRWKNRRELDGHMEAWTKEFSHYELMERLQKDGVAAMPSFDAEEILTDPHTKARELFVPVEHPRLGEQIVMGPAWKFSETPAGVFKAGPNIGEDNFKVFGGLLGMKEKEIRQLIEKKVIY